MSIKEAFEQVGVDKVALQQQVINLQEEKIKELEFDCAMLQRQLSELGNRFNKLTNRNFKDPIREEESMKHYVYGNGESRKGFTVSNYDGISWGCNALYRDAVVDNLVVMDYGMQGEVYNSGYVKEHKCWFADFDSTTKRCR